MFRFTPRCFPAVLTGALGSLLAGTVQAQITVTPTVTPLGGGGYHYDYTITNTSANELLDVAIHVLPGPDVVGSFSAPVGFKAAYDPVLGLVDYLEDTDVFTAAPLSGFVYDSALAPLTSTFDAIQPNPDPTSTMLLSTSGVTLAAVPESGNVALLGAIAVASVCAARGLRRPRSRS